MRRPLWIRLFIALWGVWFTGTLVKVPGIHACAVHSDAAGVPASHGTSAHMPMAHHQVGDRAQHSSHHDHGDACTCLGDCCGVAPALVKLDAVELEFWQSIDAPANTFAQDGPPAIERPHARPFANAPPETV